MRHEIMYGKYIISCLFCFAGQIQDDICQFWLPGILIMERKKRMYVIHGQMYFFVAEIYRNFYSFLLLLEAISADLQRIFSDTVSGACYGNNKNEYLLQ